MLVHALSRGVAQPGRALGSGPRGRWFESTRPDQFSQVFPKTTYAEFGPRGVGLAFDEFRAVSILGIRLEFATFKADEEPSGTIRSVLTEGSVVKV